ncbi:ZapG family protein [Halomonas sp. LS-001]
MESSYELIFALSGVVIGIIVGIVGYRLVSKSHRDGIQMQQRLLESERQVTELKARMGAHLIDTHKHITMMRNMTAELEQQLTQEATHWQLDDETLQHLDFSDIDAPNEKAGIAPESTETPTAGVPRDYADGKSGTLSEDFGLKERAQPPQPPRY